MANSIPSTFNRPWTIHPGTKHLILCEGNDDEGFLSSYLRSEVFSQVDLTSIQVLQVQGVSNLRKYVMVVINEDGFSQLQSLIIIRDADNDIKSAQDSVKGIFSAQQSFRFRIPSIYGLKQRTVHSRLHFF